MRWIVRTATSPRLASSTNSSGSTASAIRSSIGSCPCGVIVIVLGAEAVEPELFVDEANLGDVAVRTIHRIEQLGGRIRVVYRMEITGPEADTLGPQIGPEISADFPQVLAALVEGAE